MAWWLTGNSNYAEAVWANVNNAIANGDWSEPWKGLTDGYVAIGYDWLYPYWSQTRRAAMTNAMVAKGFGPSWTDSYWNNIGVLINSGHLMACLAVGTANEAVAESKLNTAISRLLARVNKWDPNDGAWYEGTDYGILTKWDFGQGMMAMETALGSTWSIGRTRGVDAAAREPLYIASNTRQRFTFSDIGTGSENAIGWANWWARRFDAPETFDFSRQVGSSAFNALLVPETTTGPAASGLPPDRAFRGPADATKQLFQEVVTLRENWSDPKATFVGGMGGTGNYDHDALQSGTFQLCARGVRWFVDLSSEDYGVPNHNTTNPNTHPNRWDYYRWRAEGHNTLVINPSYGPDRRWDAPIASLMNFQSAANGQRSFAVWDLTPTMTGGVTRVHRGIQLLGNRHQVLIQDEIVTPAPSTVWWFAHCGYSTSSIAIAPDGKSVMLTQGAERLWGSIVSGNGVFTTRAAAPLPTSPNPSQNSSNAYPKLAIKLTGVTNTTLAVWFVPLAAGETPPPDEPVLSALSAWNLVAMNEAPVVRDTRATCTNNVSVDVDLRTLVTDDWTYAVNMTFAVTNLVNGTVSLLSNHLARFVLATNLTGDIGFDFTARDEGGLTSNTGTVSVGVAPVTYVWTNPAGGAWSVAANWSNGVTPVSSSGARVEFFSGQTLGTGTISASNNIAGTMLLNALRLAGSSTTSVTLNVSGNPLRLNGNGDDAPTVVLDAYGSPFVCNVSNAITLSADTTFHGNHSGTFAFAGVISGAGGIIRSNTYGTLILSGNNTYAGGTTIAAGTVQLGNGGTNGTAGTGEIVNNGALRLSRLGEWSLPNNISGSGSLLVSAAGSNDVVELTGVNTFTGPVTINGGSLRITEAGQLGADEKAIQVAGNSASLRLDGRDGPVVIPDTQVLSLSNPNGLGALVNEGGDNVVEGDLLLTSGFGNSRITLMADSLRIAGLIRNTSTARGLETTGSGDAQFDGGLDNGGAGLSFNSYTKNGSGTVRIPGPVNIAGGISHNAGRLVLNGPVALGGTLSVATGAVLIGSGTVRAPTTISGTLSPGEGIGIIAFESNLTFGASSRLRWDLDQPSLTNADQLLAGQLTVTAGAKVDVTLTNAGSNVNFLHAFWRSNRAWMIVTATNITGTFSMGATSADAVGHAASTYGAFSLQNSATNVQLVWTAIPGFPVVYDPSVTIRAPATNVYAMPAGVFSLTLSAVVSNGGGTLLGTTWSHISSDGDASFADAAALDTLVEFAEPGEYILRLTASNEAGRASADVQITVSSLPLYRESRIAFTNYARNEVLTNFPVLIVLGTSIASFAYDDFQTPDGADLRMLADDGATPLNFEIEQWNPSGSSFVWVQIPRFTNGCGVIARWGNPYAVEAPACTTNGATWSNGFIGVWHLAETNGPHLDASPALATARVTQVTTQGVAEGIAGGADQFNGTGDHVSLPDMGTNARVTVECWVNLSSVPGGSDNGLVSSDPWSAGITHFKTDSGLRIKAQINGAGTVTSSSNLLAVGNWFYAAYTVAGNASADLRTFFNGGPIGSATGSTNNILTDVNLAREYSGRYLHAIMDEVRISSVARSTNWIWATYQNIASNTAFASYGAVTTPSNNAPALAAIAPRTLGAGEWLRLTNTATDADAPPQSLTYRLEPPEAGATMNATNGLFAWRAPVASAGTTNTFVIAATDNGSPRLSATQTLQVVVRPMTNTIAVASLTAASNTFAFQITGAAGPDYWLEASTNLTAWDAVSATNSAVPPFTLHAPVTTNMPQRYYRLRLGP